MLGFEPAAKQVHRRSGLRDGDALTQPGFHEQRHVYGGRCARRGVLRDHWKCRYRQPEIRAETDIDDAPVIRWTDADDRHGRTFNPNHASDDRTIRAKDRGPRLVPEHADQRSSRPLFSIVEPAAERRPQPQDVEIRRGGEFDCCVPNRAVVQVARRIRDAAGHRPRKDIGVFRDLVVDGIRGDDHRLARAIVLVDVDEAIRIGDRLLAEQDRVHEGENRGGGANGEAKDQHRRGGKAPVAHETPDPVARIAHERVPGGGPARVAGLIAHSAFAEARMDKSALL